MLSGLSGHRSEASHNPLPGGDGPADDEDGIVAADGPENVRPALAIEGSRNRLGTAGNGAQDKHLTDAVDAQKQLGEQGVERSPALFYAAVRYGVTRTLGGGNTSEPELTKVTRQGRLGDIPSTLEEKLAEVLLAAHYSRADDLEDRIVSFALVRHGVSLAPRARSREATPGSLTRGECNVMH